MITKQQREKLESYGVHLPDEIPNKIKTIKINFQKKKKTNLKSLFFIIGLVLGVLGTTFLVGTPNTLNEEQIQGAYKQGVIDIINYTQQTGNIKFIDGDQIKEVSLIDKCGDIFN